MPRRKGRPIPYKQIFSLFKPYRWLFLLVVVFSMGLNILPLAYPQLARTVIDRVVLNNDGLSNSLRFRILWGVASLIVVMAIAFGLLNFVQVRMLYKLLWGIIFDLRQKLNWHLQKLSLSFHAKQKTGKLVSRLISDINQVSALVSAGGINFILDVMVIFVVAIILCTMNFWLFLLSISIMPTYALAFRRINPLMRRMSKNVQRRIAIMSGGIAERLSGISVIQAFGTEHLEQEKFTKENERYTQQVLKRARLAGIMQAIGVVVVYSSNAIVLGFGGYFVIKGTISPGEMVAFLLYLPMLYGPLARLAEINISIQQSLGSLERIFELLSISPAIKNSPQAVESIPGDGELMFDDVSFSYDTEAVLKNISLKISAGLKVALVGPSGSGKSTMATLIPRLYDVTEGQILIDGVDVRNIKLKTLRQMIGVVQQEPFLFSTTMRENILYGRPDASVRQVIEAAKNANAHEFIRKLSRGYSSNAGERGISLSVGQRQRVCLARTILKDPKILILDEATSSLDSESENLVRAALDNLMVGRTSIIIAHRLSTIMNADFVVVLQDGKIIERGTHAELWGNDRLYRHLLQQQFGPMRDLIEKASSFDDSSNS